MGITFKKVVANGLTFMTGLKGEGPRLLFISGTGADLRNENTALSSPLTREFQVLAYDQRGLGQTDKPDQPYSMREYGEDAVAVLDAYGWDQVLVVGYSFGGMVAQELAIGWPERVKRLVLSGTTAGGVGGSSYPLHELVGLPAGERARRYFEVADTKFTPQWQAAHPEATQAKIDEAVAEESRFIHEPGAITGARRQLQARIGHDTYDRLHRISASTLVLSGNQDHVAPQAAQRAMAAQIPQCRFESMEGGHGMLWESEAVFQRISQFMLAGQG